MISDHFPRSSMRVCDDGGIYYMRQLELDLHRDGVDFEGIVWFGQELANRPRFANVYFGRLIHGAGTDECGSRLDRWIGQYYDVPKGLACGRDSLTVESYVVPPQPFSAACDFPEQYLFKSGTSGFGGELWDYFGLRSGCWQVCFERGCCRREPPPLHPNILSIVREGGARALSIEVARLSNDLLPAGFTRSPSSNLTGTWVGDDDGRYYINHVPETNEIVWYAEHKDAHPFDPSTEPGTPANGWANVFRGQLTGNTVSGMFAEVPRGVADGAGPLVLQVEGPSFVTITAPRGNYGGSRLWRVETLDVTVVVPQLNVQQAQEGLDEPLINLFFYKFDGSTVDLDDLTGSHVGVPDPQPPSILAGDDVTGILSLPTHHTTFRTTFSTVRHTNRSVMEVKNSTRIGVAGYAREVDEGYSNEYRRRLSVSWKTAVLGSIERQLQAGVLPPIELIHRGAQTMWSMYLGPWDGWPWGDPDENIAGDAEEVTFADLEALALSAATLAGVPILRTLTFTSGNTRYTCRVEFFATSRSNPGCR